MCIGACQKRIACDVSHSVSKRDRNSGINARDASMLVMPQSVTGNRDSVIISVNMNRIFLFNHELAISLNYTVFQGNRHCYLLDSQEYNGDS